MGWLKRAGTLTVKRRSSRAVWEARTAPRMAVEIEVGRWKIEARY